MSKRGQNEGSIYKGQDGRWRAIIPARFTPSGKRGVIVGSKREGNTREVVARKLALALAKKPGDAIAPSRDSVASFLKRWIESLDVRPKTIEGYRYTVETHIVPAVGSLKLQALEPHHVRAMMKLIESKKYALRTVAYARSVLRIALRQAKRDGIVTRNVADREYVDPPSVPKAEIEPLDIKDARLLLATLAGKPREALISVILALGLRIGEALGLQWKDVDFEAKTLRVMRGLQQQGKELKFVPLKTERSRRLLLIPTHRRTQRERQIRIGELWQDHDLVFPSNLGKPLSSRNVLRTFHHALDAAGLTKRGLHALRHSAATILVTQGVPLEVVADMLGHSSIRVTADVYSHFVLSRQEQAAAVMDDIMAPVGSSR
jgi:integrase